MITLLHGDDTAKSRAELERVMDAYAGREIRHVEGKSADDTLLVQSLESSSLFGGDTIVVIENLLGSLGKKQKRAEQLVGFLSRAPQETSILLWEDRTLSPGLLKLLGKASVRLFKTPVVIFQLLDGLRPGCAKTMLPLLSEVLALEPAEVVYTLMYRRIRDLIQVADHVTPERVQSWQLGRLTQQSASFTMDRLLKLHRDLLDMDIAIKTGSSPFPLGTLLEHCIVSL